MWKSRKPPEALDFETVKAGASAIDSGICSKDQKVWGLEENFAVFADRYGLIHLEFADLLGS